MNEPTTFETLMPIPVKGTIKDFDVFEALPTNSTQIIRTSEPWGIRLSWEMDGAAANFFLLMPEKWQVRLHMESIGGAPELDLPTTGPLLVNYDVPGGGLQGGTPAGPNVRQWNNITLSVPAGTVSAGVYKMAATIQLSDPAPALTPRPVVGFIEGMLVNFYD